jgi:crossover junction endodeoxyribonuclease RusA
MPTIFSPEFYARHQAKYGRDGRKVNTDRADAAASGRATADAAPNITAPRTAGQALAEARHQRFKDREAAKPRLESPAAVVVVLPWPPSGNSAVRHANGAHYLRTEVVAYRKTVAGLCMALPRVAGRYRLRLELSPPDARKRDADNAIKTAVDALVLAGMLKDDSMTYMRELVAIVNDDRRGEILCAVEAINEPGAA